MGSYVFRWPHPANEVYVTGTFDDWGKTEKLNKVGDVFEKEVKLPSADHDIIYKFVVDDNWTTDHMAPRENEYQYNENNILKAADIKKTPTHTHTGEAAAGGLAGGIAAAFAASPFISSVGPDSSTAKLAGELEVPLRRDSRQVPGGFPETPDEGGQTYGVDPIPASAGIGNPISIPAGEKLPPKSEITPNTVDSTVTTSKEGYEKDASADFPPPPKEDGQTFSVNPIPASAGIGNPISIPAGQKLPPENEITSNTIDSTATTSKEAYEKDASADFPPPPKEDGQTFGVDPIPASAGIGNPISVPAGEKLPPQSEITPNTIESTATTSKEGYEKDASAAFPPPPKENGETFGIDPIPASSGVGNPISIPAGEKLPPKSEVTPNTVNSTATTSKEAYEGDSNSAVPPPASSEPKDSAFSLPPVSKNMIPESSLPIGGNATDTMDSGPYVQSAAPESSTAALAGAVPLEPKRKAFVEGEDPTIQSAGPESTTAGLAGAVPLEPKSKATVEGEDPTIQSVGPESTTAGLAGAVPLEPKSKATVEGEDPTVQSVGPESTTAGLAGAVPLEPKSKATVEGEDPTVQSVGPESTTAGLAGAVPLEPKSKAYVEDGTLSSPAANVPEAVKESMAEAHVGAEAAADPEEVKEKAAVEKELLGKVKSTDAAGEPAPTTTAATSETAPKSAWSAYDSVTHEEGSPTTADETPSLETSKAAAAAIYEPPSSGPATTNAEVSPVPPETVDTPAAAAVTAPTPAVEQKTTPSHPKDMITPSKGQKSLSVPATANSSGKPSQGSSAASSATSSPANSNTAKEKKKKHRASGFFGKLKEKFKDL